MVLLVYDGPTRSVTEVIADIDKVAVPFHVNAAAQAAAIAAIDNIEEIEARCGVIVSERGRVEAQLSEMGWWMPAHQANFVYLSTGSDTAGSQPSWRGW